MNKASIGDGIPIELFQNPKRWCCESAALSMPANLENSAMATGLEKVSFHSNHTKKALPKKLAESFKRGFNSTWTKNFQICKLI